MLFIWLKGKSEEGKKEKGNGRIYWSHGPQRFGIKMSSTTYIPPPPPKMGNYLFIIFKQITLQCQCHSLNNPKSNNIMQKK